MDEELKRAILSELENYINKATTEAVKEFMDIPEHELYMCHFGLGLYIRNNILMPDSNSLCKLFFNNGILHKDDMSSTMLRLWHKVLNEERKSFVENTTKLF